MHAYFPTLTQVSQKIKSLFSAKNIYIVTTNAGLFPIYPTPNHHLSPFIADKSTFLTLNPGLQVANSPLVFFQEVTDILFSIDFENSIS